MKNIKIIFAVCVVVPLLALIFGGCFTASKYFVWGYGCSVMTLYLANAVIFIGACGMFYLARLQGLQAKQWLIVSGTIGVLAAVHFILVYLLSGFGF